MKQQDGSTNCLGRRLRMLVLLLGTISTGAGCIALPWNTPDRVEQGLPPVSMHQPNPLVVTISDRDFLWNQVVDVVDDYFRIVREDRVRLVGNVLTEGRIETVPRVGATLLEPWRRDSTSGFEALHSTLQSVRRVASVRVSPSAKGYEIHVEVRKELEDLSQPSQSTVGGSTQRHDDSLVRIEGTDPFTPITLGWIPIGRDISLEQDILAHLAARLNVQEPLQRPSGGMVFEDPLPISNPGGLGQPVSPRPAFGSP